MNGVFRTVAVFGIFFVLAGCFSFGADPTYYYVIEYSGEANLEGVTVPYSVVVPDAVVAEVYNRRQIVQRLAGPRLRYLSSELWAVTPSGAIADMVYDRVRALQVFSAVERDHRRATAEYRLTVVVDKLEYYCCDADPEARLALKFRLESERDGTIVLDRSVRETVTLTEKSPLAFVIAVSEVLSRELDEFIFGLAGVDGEPGGGE
ncbi:MAG: hypothetical protein EA426_14385 [Spirochaetaceae bacterium]|nr:MAG: hypothetical protein EA426_14385 [Spirochaetaceae bacterium]